MRPLLAPGSFLRPYVSDRLGWVVMGGRPTARFPVAASVRVLLERADGNRELGELLPLVEQELGRAITLREAETELRPLVEAGVVLDAEGGLPAGRRAPPTGLASRRIDGAAIARLRPVATPDTGLDCDGRGGCCRLYDRIHLDARDAANLHAAYGDARTPGGLTLATALRADRDSDGFVLAAVEGACPILERDGRCGVHARLGVDRKPRGCRSYPLGAVVCGDELAVGVTVECRCVIDFAASGPPLADSIPSLLARVTELGAVTAVADEVPIDGVRRVPRERYATWRTETLARLAGASDVAAWALDEAARWIDRPSPPLATLLVRLADVIARVAEELAIGARSTATAFAATDLQVPLFEWAASAGARLLAAARAGADPGPAVAGEAMLARQLLHTHELLATPIVSSLVRLALRLALARAGAPSPLPPQLLPLSTVGYLLRAQRLDRTLDDEWQRLVDALG